VNVFHLPLAQRKTICGRLLFFQAAYPDRLRFLVAGAESEFDQVRDNVFSLTEQAISSSHDSEPLDQFLKKLQADLGYQMHPQLTGKHANLFEPLLADIGRNIAAISCDQCSPIRPRVCDGGSQDDEIVRTGGVCIAPIQKMFEIAAQATQQWYAKSCNLFRVQDSPQLVLSTSFTNGKPHDIPGDYFVGGVTRQHDAAKTAEINLSVWPKKFDWNTYAAILYVLFHECICHAYQGTKAFRPRPVSDGFAEGWMDWIAFECFRKHLELSPKTPSLQAYLDAGTQLHLLRVDYNHPEKSAQSSICAFGRSVAQKFSLLLHRLPKFAPDPWASLLMASFDLDMAGGLSDQELVILDDCLPAEGALDSPRLEQVTEAVSKYLVSKDIYDIFKLLADHI
jgi:hypothetical protein